MQPVTPSTTSGRAAAASMLRPREHPLLGFFAHGAGVDQDEIGARRIVRSSVSAPLQKPEDHLRVRHVHLAAVGLHIGQLGGRPAGRVDRSGGGRPAGAGRDRSRWMYNPHMRWKGAAAAVFMVSVAVLARASVARADAPWVYRSIVLPRGEVAVDLGLGLGHQPDELPDNGSITGFGLNLALSVGITHELEFGVRTGSGWTTPGRSRRPTATVGPSTPRPTAPIATPWPTPRFTFAGRWRAARPPSWASNGGPTCRSKTGRRSG